MYKIILLIAALSGLSVAYAEGPDYQVLPQLHGLSVNYHVQSNTLNTTLYAINHETFAIVCDAAMTTNKQEKKRGQEKRVDANKTTAFSFKHRTSIESIKLYLICEPTPEAKAALENSKTAKSGAKGNTTATHESQENDVPVEDFGSP